MRLLVLICACIGIFFVFYFSWLPDPDIGKTLPFPTWFNKWTDAHANLRTAVPFIFLGAFAELMIKKNQNRNRVGALVLLTAVVFIAEIGQLVLPKRHFDWEDVGYGIVGASLGMILLYTIKKCILSVRI